jgi:Ca2+/Na+ antiporter
MDIEDALRAGYDRTTARSGLLLAAVFFVISLISTIAAQSDAQRTLNQMGGQLPEFMQDLPMAGGPSGPLPLAFNIPGSLTTLMNLGSSIAFIVMTIAAYRVFASDAREKIPEEAYKRNMGSAALNGIIASIIFGILFVIGLVLLVIPGIYIGVSLAFFLIFISLEDKSFIDSLQSSWELTKGRRLSVFLLFVAVLVVNIVVSVIGGIASAVVGAAVPQLGAIVNIAVGAALTVFGLAVLLNAYYQLQEEGGAETVEESAA